MMKKKDVLIIAIQVLIILAFFLVFYLNNEAVGATFLLPGVTHFETCWKTCDPCHVECLVECCQEDPECLNDISIMCQKQEVIQYV